MRQSDILSRADGHDALSGIAAALAERARRIPSSYLEGQNQSFALATETGRIGIEVHEGAMTVSVAPERAGSFAFVAQIADAQLRDLLASKTDILTLANTGQVTIGVQDGGAPARHVQRLQYILTSLLARWHLTDALIGEIERPRDGYTTVTAIDRIDADDVAGFAVRAAEGRPVVLRGAADAWGIRALGFDATVARYADVPVSLLMREHASTSAGGGARYETSTLGRYVRDIARKSPDDPDFPYLAANAIPAEIEALVTPPRYFPADAFANTRMWIGPKSTGLNCHRDLVDNFLAQAFGRKSLRLFSPDQARSLYPKRLGGNPFYQPSGVDIDEADLGATPNFVEARPVTCVIEEGEMLYLPAGWWHAVSNLSLSWSFNFFAVHQPPRVLGDAAGERA